MPTHKARFDPSGRKCPPNSRLPECRVSLEKPFTPHSHRAPLPRPFQPGAQPRQARQPPLPGTVALPGAVARGDVPGGPGPTSQTPTAQARGDGSAIGIGAAAGGVAGAAYGARRVAPNVRARAQGYRRVPGRQLTERFRLGTEEFGEEGEFSQGRSTTTRQPSRFGMRRRVTRPSARSFGERQLQTERFGPTTSDLAERFTGPSRECMEWLGAMGPSAYDVYSWFAGCASSALESAPKWSTSESSRARQSVNPAAAVISSGAPLAAL